MIDIKYCQKTRFPRLRSHRQPHTLLLNKRQKCSIECWKVRAALLCPKSIAQPERLQRNAKPELAPKPLPLLSVASNFFLSLSMPASWIMLYSMPLQWLACALRFWIANYQRKSASTSPCALRHEHANFKKNICLNIQITINLSYRNLVATNLPTVYMPAKDQQLQHGIILKRGTFVMLSCQCQVESFKAPKVIQLFVGVQMDVSENSGTSKSSMLKGFSIINHPFWGTTIFGNTQMGWYCYTVIDFECCNDPKTSKDPMLSIIWKDIASIQQPEISFHLIW